VRLVIVAAGITWDNWIDSAGDRAAKAAAAKAASEKAAAEEAERQRQAAMMQQDKDKGYKKALDLKNGYEGLRAKGSSSSYHAGNNKAQPLVWKVSEDAAAGSKVPPSRLI
jgi:starch synthase